VQGAIFGAKVNPGILHQVVRWQRAKSRAGTHTTLTRSAVSGGGAKPWRQKGTGRARAGSSSSPVWVGGGVAHGPKQRSYEFRLNKKERRQAICGALSQRRGEGRLMVIRDFGLSEIKTKAAVGVLRQGFGIEEGKKVLVVLPEGDEINTKSLRNISGVRILSTAGLNVYDVLNAEYVLMADDAIEPVQARLGY